MYQKTVVVGQAAKLVDLERSIIDKRDRAPTPFSYNPLIQYPDSGGGSFDHPYPSHSEPLLVALKSGSKRELQKCGAAVLGQKQRSLD